MKSIMLLAILGLFSGLAFAGYLQPAPIQITMNPDGSGMASGDMVSARFANDDQSNIGCGTRTYASGSVSNYAFCQVRDSNGVQAMCTVFDSELMKGIASIGDYSFIVFSWNADGECVQMGASTQSMYMPDFRDQGSPSAGAPGRSGR